MGRISGRPWGIPVAAYGENPMATDIRADRRTHPHQKPQALSAAGLDHMEERPAGRRRKAGAPHAIVVAG